MLSGGRKKWRTSLGRDGGQEVLTGRKGSRQKKSGDMDGYLGEKRRKRGVDGISVGEEGGPVVGKLGPAVRHSGHYSGRERETIAGKCLCRKEVPSNEIQDDARANLAGKVQTVGKVCSRVKSLISVQSAGNDWGSTQRAFYLLLKANSVLPISSLIGLDLAGPATQGPATLRSSEL